MTVAGQVQRTRPTGFVERQRGQQTVGLPTWCGSLLSPDLAKILNQRTQIGAGERYSVVCQHRRVERRCRSIVQIGPGLPDITQRGNVDAGQRSAQALAAGGLFQGADVLQPQQAGVGEGRAAVAGSAALRREHGPTGRGGDAERTTGVSVGAGLETIQRPDVGRQRIQVAAHTGLRIAQGLAPRTGIEGHGAHQARATCQAADLTFEVLHFVEIAAPVQHALRTCATAQRDRIAQAFTLPREVPGTPIAAAVVVATRTAHVTIAGKPGIAGVIKMLLSQQHGSDQFFACHSTESGQKRDTQLPAREQWLQVVHANRAIHEVVHVQRLAIVGQHQALRRAPHIEAHDLEAPVRIDDSDFAAGLQRDEQVHTPAVIGSGAGDAGVIVVDTFAQILLIGSQHDTRADGAHGVLEIQPGPVAQGSALDVVLFGGNPRLGAVRGNGGRTEVVGNAATLVLEIGLVAVLQHDGAHEAQPAGADDHELGTVARRRRDRCGALAGQRRRDESRNVDAGAVGADGKVTRVGAHRHAAELRKADRIELKQLTGCLENDERLRRGGRHRNAEGPRGTRQSDGVDHRVGGRINDADGIAALVGDPDQSIGGHGDGTRGVSNQHLGQLDAGHRVERADTVVVLIDNPQPGVATGRDLDDDIAGNTGLTGGGCQVHGLKETARSHDLAGVGRADRDAVAAGIGEGVADRRRTRPRRVAGTVAEIPPVRDVHTALRAGRKAGCGARLRGGHRWQRVNDDTIDHVHCPHEARTRDVDAVTGRDDDVVAARRRG